jgi:UDP-N-acetylglucosamine transferase subunit ALG13
MIFIMVGTHTQSFDRLLKKIDELIENKKITQKVIAQIGNTTYCPKNYDYKNFFPEEKRNQLLSESSIIISHAGAGCIIDSLLNGKIPIVVPRLKKYNEHNNNHQIDIIKEFEKQNKIIAIYNIEKLEDVLTTKNTNFEKNNSKLLRKLEKYLSDL